MQEANLIDRARCGDRAAFTLLYKKHAKYIEGTCINMLKDKDDVEDAIQETFIKAWRHIQKFKGGSSFATWVYRIAVNVCIDQMRKNKKRSEYNYEDEVEKSPCFNDFCENNFSDADRIRIQEVKEAIYFFKEALIELSPAHQRVLLLTAEGFKYREIAEIEKVPLGTIMSRLFHGKRKIQKLVAQKLLEFWLRAIKTFCASKVVTPSQLYEAFVFPAIFGYKQKEWLGQVVEIGIKKGCLVEFSSDPTRWFVPINNSKEKYNRKERKMDQEPQDEMSVNKPEDGDKEIFTEEKLRNKDGKVTVSFVGIIKSVFLLVGPGVVFRYRDLNPSEHGYTNDKKDWAAFAQRLVISRRLGLLSSCRKDGEINSTARCYGIFIEENIPIEWRDEYRKKEGCGEDGDAEDTKKEVVDTKIDPLAKTDQVEKLEPEKIFVEELKTEEKTHAEQIAFLKGKVEAYETMFTQLPELIAQGVVGGLAAHLFKKD